MRGLTLSRLLLCALLLALAPQVLSAQRIRGRLIDAENGAGVPSGSVLLLHERDDAVLARATSDSLGFFVLDVERPGKYRLRGEMLGFLTTTAGPMELLARQVVRLELALAMQAVPLEPLRVVGLLTPTAPAWSRIPRFRDHKEYLGDKLGIGHFLTRDDIERRNPGSALDLLRTIPGVRLYPSGSAGRYVVRFSRAAMLPGGGRDCPPAVYVDGTKMSRPARTFGAPDRIEPADEFLANFPPTHLEGIEVYDGASVTPPDYIGSDARCGVIGLWTRRGG